MGLAFQHDEKVEFRWKVTYLDKFGYKHVRYFVTVKGAYEFAMDNNGDIEKLPEYDRETYINKEEPDITIKEFNGRPYVVGTHCFGEILANLNERSDTDD